MLVWEEPRGVRVRYRDPRELGERHGAAEHRPVRERTAALLAGLAREAAGG